MRYTTIITVREKLLGHDDAQLLHAYRMLGADGPKLGFDIFGAWLTVWQSAFWSENHGHQWGEEQVAMLRKNYPERDFDFTALRVLMQD